MNAFAARLMTIVESLGDSAKRIGQAAIAEAQKLIPEADLVIDDAAPVVAFLGPAWQAEYAVLRAGADKLNAELQAVELAAAAANIMLPTQST